MKNNLPVRLTPRWPWPCFLQLHCYPCGWPWDDLNLVSGNCIVIHVVHLEVTLTLFLAGILLSMWLTLRASWPCFLQVHYYPRGWPWGDLDLVSCRYIITYVVDLEVILTLFLAGTLFSTWLITTRTGRTTLWVRSSLTSITLTQITVFGGTSNLQTWLVVFSLVAFTFKTNGKVICFVDVDVNMNFIVFYTWCYFTEKQRSFALQVVSAADGAGVPRGARSPRRVT